uniref:HMG box domain-containing protein n=1 Tax=Neogobius melanostomus TaxID=47308 RepID=A0A8C6S7L9_9GOBI
MTQSIAERVRDLSWSTGLKHLDWEIVAFKQFTPEECSAKWHEIMQKLRKIKTLQELIMDAQSDKLPKRPLSANAIYFAEKQAKFRKRNPGINGPELMKLANEKYKKLPPEVKVGLHTLIFFWSKYLNLYELHC